MTKEKYSNRYGINYFWNIFRLRKVQYPKGYFFMKNHSNSNIFLTKPLFRTLVLSYLDVYFEDFYSHNDSQYFPLSGELIKGKGKGFYKNNKSNTVTDSIIWTWYLRPAINYVTNLKIIKLKGSSSRLGVLEEKYKRNFDAGLLPKAKEILKDLNSNDKLYVQW